VAESISRFCLHDAAGGNQEIDIVHGKLTCHGQAADTLVDDLIDQRHGNADVTETACRQEVPVLNITADSLSDGYLFID